MWVLQRLLRGKLYSPLTLLKVFVWHIEEQGFSYYLRGKTPAGEKSRGYT